MARDCGDCANYADLVKVLRAQLKSAEAGLHRAWVPGDKVRIKSSQQTAIIEAVHYTIFDGPPFDADELEAATEPPEVNPGDD